MQIIGQKFQNLSEISRFQIIEKMRFHLTVTHKNCYNSLIFWDRELIFWIKSFFMCFATLYPPPQGSRVKNLTPFFIFDIQEKSKSFKWRYPYVKGQWSFPFGEGGSHTMALKTTSLDQRVKYFSNCHNSFNLFKLSEL